MTQHITGFTVPQLQFLAWLKKYQPQAFADALNAAGVPPGSTLGEIQPNYGMGGLGATSTTGTSWWSSIVNNLSNLGTAYLGYTTQQKILNTQIARAQAGLPPLNASAYTVPVPVQVSASPQTVAQLGTTVSTGLSGLGMPLLIGGGVIAVALIFGKKRKG